ncbi:hypothetical protein ELS24_10180 [Achromobacter spanius]|uniref:recombination protein NinB n=1 Tax=Achromobacter spanius TaxID=217203 RepID=UPI000F8FB877|nr:recombination protein NinB [Achromobacter spanius]AZS78779.1 hypothetical protein ELS24_10180 [Achromobacter spanius]
MNKPRIRVTPATRQMLIQAILNAPDGHYVAIQEPNRSLNQNAKLHAMCADIAAQMTWMNRKLGVEDWKRLLVDSWMRETDRMQLVPSLDGKGVVSLGQQTRTIGVKDMAELIESILAFGAMNNVQWTDEPHIPGWVK